MNPVTKLMLATEQFRSSFGQIRGIMLWVALLKEKFLRHSAIFSVKVPGIKHRVFLRARTSDVEVFCQIFGRRELDEEIACPVRYIIDAGANIGLASVFFSNKYPDAAIDAIEVADSNISVLKLNVNLYPNIRVIPKGLWGRSGWLRIRNPSVEPWAFEVEETSDDDPNKIPAIGVQDLIKERRVNSIDLFKMDIEGAETDVFRSGDVSWIESVACLMVELHDYARLGCEKALLSAVGGLKYSRGRRGEYHIFQFFH